MTRITLDLAKLVSDGELTEQEAERLKGMAVTGKAVSVIVNLLCIFGALALAAGVVALKPDPSTGLFLAIIALAIAGFVRFNAFEEWKVLGDGMAIAGTFRSVWMVWPGVRREPQWHGHKHHTHTTNIGRYDCFSKCLFGSFYPLGDWSGTGFGHGLLACQLWPVCTRGSGYCCGFHCYCNSAVYLLLERIRKSGYSLWEMWF